ncbi:dihydromonapterin reductase [Aestuariibacter halophilus]|uniref:Dihydromonapterin reductase n=1 Tax=Fluctibacter halophilus TaxID=226011 RepID=A0ABS8GAX1_9ALTE|nr:dihydromonapterin reductase [Aestuariibacter halophilus]MCC2617737.1 dihydromonapterin reductase [Aestuariibacter halophilus]
MEHSPAPILITGGAQRIGLAVAEALLADGHHVLVTYRSQRPGLATLKAAGATLIEADFTEQQGIERFIHYLKTHHDRLRAIIHNASDWEAESESTPAAQTMARMLNIHVQVPYQINLACADMLGADNIKGDIIHMTDGVQDKGSAKHLAYAASKAALHNLTLSFAQRLAPAVKVNSIAPALLMFNEGDDEAYRAKALKKSLLETCPGPSEAVNTVRYLLASDYITGRCLYLDGGRHLK